MERQLETTVPKQKTHKGAAKRMKLTGKGKVKMAHAGKSHLNSTTPPKKRRQLKGTFLMKGKQAAETVRMLSPGRN